MAVFSYTGLDRSRASIRGTVAADTPRQARDLLRSEGVLVQGITPCDQIRKSTWWSRLASRRMRNQWATAVHELSMLLHTGIPMTEALDTVSQQHRGSFRTALISLRDRVASGAGLAEAMADRPDLFDEASVHLVEVGENAGTLEDVLDQLADFKQRMLQMKDQVFTALMYPVFLVVFGTGAAVFLMTSVLPPLLESLQETLETIPWPTQVVKTVSDLFVEHGLLIFAGFAGVLALVVVAWQTPPGRRLVDRTVLRLPMVGPMALRQGVSRIAMIVSTLSRSGVVLTKAIELAAQSTTNVVLRDALEECGRRVAAGEEVAAAFERSDVFPPLAVRVLSVGQESGRLDEMLTRLAADYDRQNATVSARLSALLEPILILVMAGFVGFLLVATILPILEAGNVMQ